MDAFGLSPDSDHPPLRYVPIDALHDHVLSLESHEVRGAGGHELGDIDGFLVDSASGQPRYVVVHAGGRVPFRRFILAVEHTRLDVGRKALRVDLDPEAIGSFPVVRDDRIESLQSDELGRYHDAVRHACCADDEDLRQFERERQASALPGWWDADAWLSLTSRQPSQVSTEDRFVAGHERGLRSLAADKEREPRASPDHAQPGDVNRSDES
jgi:hypothetical protein